jgi:DNA repair exonuclease SbcCD ATPase subunit
MEGEDLQELVQKMLGIIKEQEARIAGLEAQIVELKATIARLQKDSRNSSKPPSSDIVKPKAEAQKNNHGKPLKTGGQKGHKKHERKPFPPDQVDQFIEVTLDACPVCGGALHEDEQVVTKQQIEIVEKPYIVKAYRR